MKLRFALFLTLCMVALALRAQVTGLVTDTDGEPIAGANVFWLGTTQGTSTDSEGRFSINPSTRTNSLVTSYIGYDNDTTHHVAPTAELTISLRAGILVDEVEVAARRMGTMKMRQSVMNEDMISSAELLRAACCNLGESFTTNPSVDVSYSDAATGAKQIRLLGLSGTYVQMLTENIPNYRGAAAPFALGYIPGPWMQSIQVSKGCSSVKNGYESIAGQINVEFLKPQTDPSVHVNLYGNTMSKFEANADANIHLNRRLSTALLAHYENGNTTHDNNDDGFLDLPRVEQWNLQNRWAWMGDCYVFQASLKVLHEDRTSGQASHAHSASSTTDTSTPLYQIGMQTNRYEAFTKNAYIYNKEKNGNVALILAGSIHKQDASYGYKVYDVDQNNLYASLMLETELGAGSSISLGLSLNHDNYDQDYRLEQDADADLVHARERENVYGAYVQYTYNLTDRLVVMGGLRWDHSNVYGSFVTPRAHIKWTPNDIFNLRASVGRGYRTNHVLAENNYLLASGRQVSIADDLQQEQAWNYGLSASLYIPIRGRTLTLNAEYYYTHFHHQLVCDLDSDPHAVQFGNLDGRSYSHTFQAEASCPIFEGFTLTAAYRLTDVRTSYGGQLMRKPLTGRYKGLLTASYQTPLGLWQFDVTLQLNGGGRMPTPYDTDDGTLSWAPTYPAYEQLSAQITRWFRHWSVYIGGENLTGYKQRNPIVSASDPWSTSFDSTMIWAPIHGAVGYIGLRLNW